MQILISNLILFRRNHLKHDSGIKPQGLAVLQGVLDGNVQVTANAKKVHLSMKHLRGIKNQMDTKLDGFYP